MLRNSHYGSQSNVCAGRTDAQRHGDRLGHYPLTEPIHQRRDQNRQIGCRVASSRANGNEGRGDEDAANGDGVTFSMGNDLKPNAHPKKCQHGSNT